MSGKFFRYHKDNKTMQFLIRYRSFWVTIAWLMSCNAIVSILFHYFFVAAIFVVIAFINSTLSILAYIQHPDAIEAVDNDLIQEMKEQLRAEVMAEMKTKLPAKPVEAAPKEEEPKGLERDEEIYRLHSILSPIEALLVQARDIYHSQTTPQQQEDISTIIALAKNGRLLLHSWETDDAAIETHPLDKTNFELNSAITSVINIYQGKYAWCNIALKPNKNAPFYLHGDPIRIKQCLILAISGIMKNNLKQEVINIWVAYRVRKVTGELLTVDFEITTTFKIDITENAAEKLPHRLNFAILERLLSVIKSKVESKTTEQKTVIRFTKNFVEISEEQMKAGQGLLNGKQQDNSDQNAGLSLANSKILMVDDTAVNRSILKYFLQEFVKGEIVEKENGQEAVDEFKANKFDVILMDIQMPVMDGLEAIKEIRNHEFKNQLNPTPIIAISANSFYDNKKKAIEIGADDYISKPFDKRELAEKMRKLIHIKNIIDNHG